MKKKNSANKTGTFGTCSFGKTSPALESLSAATKVLNLHLPFAKALQLSLAIDECVRELNRYKRSSKEGKHAALNLAIHLDQRRISIHEGKTDLDSTRVGAKWDLRVSSKTTHCVFPKGNFGATARRMGTESPREQAKALHVRRCPHQPKLVNLAPVRSAARARWRIVWSSSLADQLPQEPKKAGAFSTLLISLSA